MKKIISLLLLLPFLACAQNPTTFPYGIKNIVAPSNTTPTYFVTQEADGIHKKTPTSYFAKDNNIVHLNGDESITGVKSFNNTYLRSVDNPVPLTVSDLSIAGNLSGTYSYAVTYYTLDGETDAGGYLPITVTASQVRINIPISSNPLVIGRKIYRTISNPFDSVIKKLLATISNNTTTFFDDNIVDGSLTLEVPRVNTTGSQFFSNNKRIGFASAGSTSFGFDSFNLNTGYADTAFGAYVLTNNTTGYRNSAFGTYALTNNTTGYENSAFAVHALNNNTTGQANTAFGYSALFSNTTGYENTALGQYSLFLNTTGLNNIAVGSKALHDMVSGQGNVAVGSNSLNKNTGYFNTGIGTDSGNTSISAWLNTLVGFRTGYAGSDFGWANTILGANAGYNLAGSGNVFIGSYAGYYESSSNKLFIDNAQRTSESDARSKALVYGNFDSIVANQFLTVNGKLNATAHITTGGTTSQLVDGTGALQTIPNGRPYKVYTALLSQSGTSAPTTTVLENTLGGAVVWTYGSLGQYIATLTGAFTANKTAIFITKTAGGAIGAMAGAYWNNVNSVVAYTASSANYVDSNLSSATIEIRVYN